MATKQIKLCTVYITTQFRIKTLRRRLDRILIFQALSVHTIVSSVTILPPTMMQTITQIPADSDTSLQEENDFSLF